MFLNGTVGSSVALYGSFSAFTPDITNTNFEYQGISEPYFNFAVCAPSDGSGTQFLDEFYLPGNSIPTKLYLTTESINLGNGASSLPYSIFVTMSRSADAVWSYHPISALLPYSSVWDLSQIVTLIVPSLTPSGNLMYVNDSISK